MTRFALALVAVLALALPAGAQGLGVPSARPQVGTGLPTAPNPGRIQKPKAPKATLLELSAAVDRVDVDDLAYAIAIAPEEDKNLVACLNGIQALVHGRRAALNNPGLPRRPSVGTIYDYVKVRGLAKALSPGSAVRTACAGLAEESRTSVPRLIASIITGTAAASVAAP